jgi:CRISPR-associated protein Csc1
MTMHIYRADLTLMEHTYFASREVGLLYESEPLLGNYALTYALGLCAAPYDWSGPPRYKTDLGPLNARSLYVTPAMFPLGKLRYAFSQFNALSDSYYARFDQNAISMEPEKRARATNFPQNGKIRMLGAESQATFYLLAQTDDLPLLPSYIRLGKFNSKARVVWEELTLLSARPQELERELKDVLLNAADLPEGLAANLRAFSLYNIYPTPLLSRCLLRGPFWHARGRNGQDVYLPAGMRYGVEQLEQ